MSFDKILYTERRLENTIEDIKELFTEFKEITLHYHRDKLHELRNSSYEIKRKLCTYLVNGITLSDAKDMIFNEYSNLPYHFISSLCNEQYSRQFNQIKMHKVYACHKLHDAGINNVTIAKLLSLSPATITKYLLIPCKLE